MSLAALLATKASLDIYLFIACSCFPSQIDTTKLGIYACFYHHAHFSWHKNLASLYYAILIKLLLYYFCWNIFNLFVERYNFP